MPAQNRSSTTGTHDATVGDRCARTFRTDGRSELFAINNVARILTFDINLDSK